MALSLRACPRTRASGYRSAAGIPRLLRAEIGTVSTRTQGKAMPTQELLTLTSMSFTALST